MHRSRPFVLAILAAAAACSKRDPSEGNDLLSQDRTLVARPEKDKGSRLPGACGAITVAAPPSATDQQQAEELTRQAGVAEMHGNIPDARTLLRRASNLDGTNKSAAYHLGRTSEALGDRATAMTSYCHYLALAPTTAEAAEARQRVADLSRTIPRAAVGANTSITTRHSSAVTTTRRASHGQSTVGSRAVASAVVRRPVSPSSSAGVTEPPTVVPSGSAQPQTPSEPRPTSRETGRGAIGAQSAIIGAAAGAIFGAATGRSVKSAVIGAAAGGLLGTVIGSTSRPSRL